MAFGRPVRTYCPEYGLVRTLLVVVALGLGAAVTAPAVAGAVGIDLVEGLLYGVAAAAALAAIGRETLRQRRRNPHEFVAGDVLAQFYEQQRPEPREHAVHLAVTAVGAAGTWLGAGPALGRVDGALLLLERQAAGEPLPPVDPVNVGWAIVTAVGLVVFVVGVDRLLVGGYRELRYVVASRRTDG